MLAACEAGEVFTLLEGGAVVARDACDALSALYGAVREPWLTRALLLYHARTGSVRAIDLLARAPDHHARHLLDALQEQLRAERHHAHHALAALAPLVARRPPWLHLLPAHQLTGDLMRAARIERDPLPLLHALLALAALLPAAPALAAQNWNKLAEVLMRPAMLDPQPPPPTRAHLQLAQLALFHALYATHPCTLLQTLREEHAAAREHAREAWERNIAPLLESVRLHPALVTGSRRREADAARFARFEIHDVVAECRRLSLQPRFRGEDRVIMRALVPVTPATPAAGSGAHAARAAATLRPGAEPWFLLSDRCGADSAPHTPLPADADATEPPEAAVEATPENTPLNDARAHFRFPAESAAVRAIGRRSQPSSPLRKETSPSSVFGETQGGRLARLHLERAAFEAEGTLRGRRVMDSPVPFAGAPPPAGAPVARPEPSRPTARQDPEPLNVEDREVLELTTRAQAEEEWAEREATPAPRASDPRVRYPRPSRASRQSTAAPRRSTSCSARLGGTHSCTVATQTVDTWPEPYEFLIADFYRHLPDETYKHTTGEKISEPILPSEKLDTYLAELYSGRGGTHTGTELADQLALAHAQLMYERWRREAHAERNRRLLGRCRQMRALELQNAALKERVRAAQRERDELRARLAAAPPPTPAPLATVCGEHETRLETALVEERAARDRAEAALREAEAQHALDAAELQRTRGESFEAARHVEALARAALAADRRAEHVRRLRRELLVLAEREARLVSATRAAVAPTDAAVAAGEERAMRAMKERLAAAKAEADAANMRAELATARVHDLETALATRDALVSELKRNTRLAAEEHAACLRAVQDKYVALMRTLRSVESRQLQRLAGGEERRAAPRPERACAEGAVAGARPALAECSRARRLVERAEEPDRP